MVLWHVDKRTGTVSHNAWLWAVKISRYRIFRDSPTQRLLLLRKVRYCIALSYISVHNQVSTYVCIWSYFAPSHRQKPQQERQQGDVDLLNDSPISKYPLFVAFSRSISGQMLTWTPTPSLLFSRDTWRSVHEIDRESAAEGTVADTRWSLEKADKSSMQQYRVKHRQRITTLIVIPRGPNFQFCTNIRNEGPEENNLRYPTWKTLPLIITEYGEFGVCLCQMVLTSLKTNNLYDVKRHALGII